MSETIEVGRLGNQIIRNVAVSLLAQRHNLFIKYCNYEKIKQLGITLFSGENNYDSSILLTDDNYTLVLNTPFLTYNIEPNQHYFQTKEITNMIYHYLHQEDVRECIVNANPFKNRYKSNNDLYVHIRLTDAEQYNPGINYYLNTISNICFDRLYISSDDINHSIIKQIIHIYPSSTILTYDEIQTFQFGSTCKHIILSHGSFSAVIGYLGFFSTVYYPAYDINKMWYGDMFSIDGWNKMETNDLSLCTYYINHKDEFYGEDGHKMLLSGLKQLIQPITDTKVIGIDVGSCVGNYIENLEYICSEKDSSILCFEPNPLNIETLESKIRHKKHVKLFKQCLSNETTVDSFYNMKDSVNFHGNALGGLRSGGTKICDVEVNRLDDVLDMEFNQQNIGDDRSVVIKFININAMGNDTNVIKGLQRYLHKTQYIVFECSNCLDDFRGPGIKEPMKDIVDFLSQNGFNTYRVGTKKLLKVNDEYWHPMYEKIKYWSSCFAIKKNDPLIHQLVNEQFDYIFTKNCGIKVPSFVINLPSEIYRKNHMKELLSTLDLSFSFFEACNGDHIQFVKTVISDKVLLLQHDNDNYFYDLNLRLNGTKLTKGELGCAISHIQLYKKLVNDTTNELYLIFEDDAKMMDCITPDIIHFYLRNLPEPSTYDVAHLSVSDYYPFKKCININSYYYTPEKDYFNRLTSYVVTKRGAQKLLQAVYPCIGYPADDLLSTLHLCSHDFKVIVPNQTLFVHAGFESVIGKLNTTII
jgi:glycosyl transferase family 25